GNIRCRCEDQARAGEQMMFHLRRVRRGVIGVWRIAVPLISGPRPASVALAQLDAMTADPPFPYELIARGVLLAMLDRVEEGWTLASSAADRVREFGVDLTGGWLATIADY